MGAVAGVASAVTIVAVGTSVFPYARLFFSLYGLVVAFVTIGDFFRSQLVGSVPYAWTLVALFAACEMTLSLSKIVAHRPEDRSGAEGLTMNLITTTPVRVLCGVPMLTQKAVRELGKELQRVAPMMASVYASFLGWCMVMVVWVGVSATRTTQLRIVSDLLVASLALVACCATFEISVKMEDVGAEHQIAKNKNNKCGGTVTRHLLMNPSLAVAMTMVSIATAVVVLPTELAVAYVVLVVVLPSGVIVTDMKRLQSFCRKSKSRNVAYLWDVRMAAECAWWSTVVAVEAAHIQVIPADVRLDAATLALSLVSLMSAAAATVVVLVHTGPLLVRAANELPETAKGEGDA